MAELLQSLDAFVASVQLDDMDRQLDGATGLRKLLSIERNPPIDAVIATGVIPRLKELLMNDERPRIQFEVAWALTNVASGNSQHTATVVGSGIVPVFTRLLSSPDADVREQVIWGLGNIAGDTTQLRDVVLGSGALEPLMAAMSVNNSPKLTLLRNATWTISNLVSLSVRKGKSRGGGAP